ncbi:HAD family hydrolase [Mesorhizobium sp. RP14(2022)]|uniref:phosphoglycolate phosphatase n=1 Tax=Mesorhizobium liriopis TaxID=2953882 RepID=A0ABT1C0C0_9HYPH|nr:HAD family hydrolase [Mesorhizobium liriopis]MCO6048279.1 HAD family hydrolase [Mesorhizobium liriopis]
MGKIKAVLFDKDGTLIDFQKTWFAVGDAMALAAANGDRAEADRLLEQGGYDFTAARFKPDSVFAAGTNAEIVALWYPELSDAEQAERAKAYDAFTAVEGAKRAVPLPGLEAAIRALHARGLRLGVATNDSEEGARLTLEALGLSPFFDAAYGYDSVPNPKPAPDPLYAFAKVVGCEPQEIAMVGDNNHDLVMAKAGGAGLAVGVLSGTGTREILSPLADVILDSVAELPDLLAKA